MKKASLTYIVIFMTVLVSSCGKDLKEQDADNKYEAIKSELTVEETSYSIDASQQDVRIKIVSNSYWSATTPSDWLHLDKSKGKGDGMLSVQADINSSATAERHAVVSVSDGIKTINITITQAPDTEEPVEPVIEKLSVSESQLHFGYNGGSIEVAVYSNVDWTVSSNAKWCTVENNTSSVFVNAGINNSYSPRSATITVRGLALTANIMVNQAAAKEPTLGVLGVSNITKTSADCQFTYNSSDLEIQINGVCYSSSVNNPTTSNSCVYSTTSSYSGTSTHRLPVLNENTVYYVRPYVTTSVGTTYGETKQFTTLKTNSPDEGDNPTPTY